MGRAVEPAGDDERVCEAAEQRFRCDPVLNDDETWRVIREQLSDSAKTRSAQTTHALRRLKKETGGYSIGGP